jgi:hypothetical protein
MNDDTYNPLDDDFIFHPDGSSISEEAIDELADHLRLPPGVMYSMPIAWQEDEKGGCWVFPETDGADRRVGATRRYRDGRTEVVPGSRRGLSAPDDFQWECPELPCLLPVGVTDTLALTALELSALGRPANTEGLDELAERLRDLPPDRPLLLFAKGAGLAGQEAARLAAAELTARLGRPVSWAQPPDGAHDLRAWVVGRLSPQAPVAAWRDLGRQLLKLLRPQAPDGPAAQAITADQLLQRDLPEPAWVIDALLPEGATLLAGKPKSGKSWLALQLALAVAGGGSALGDPGRPPGDVLYLALEDTQRRLKARLERLLASAAAPPPTRLSLMTSWKRLDEGGRDDLAAWLSAHPEARLVVIDTLAALRPAGGSYGADYQAIAALRRLAARFGVALLIVHHVRKQSVRDPFDAVSGTLGLTGAADAVWILCRSRRDNEAVLHVTGRDLDEQELALAWVPQSGLWTLLGPAAEHRQTTEQARVQDLLTQCGRPLTPTQVASLLDKKLGATKMLLWRMAEKGLLVAENGTYGLPPPAGGETA